MFHKGITYSICLTIIIALVLISGGAFAVQGTPLPGNKIDQFVDPLPVLDVAGGSMETVIAGAGEITLNMLEFKANMMPSTFVPATGTYTGTWVFGYRVGPTTAPPNAVGTYIGPVIVATRNVPTQIRYVNNLTAVNIHWRDWIDQSLHSAFHQAVGQTMPTSGNTDQYLGPVLAVPHLHGGEDPAIVDGGPEAWFRSNYDGPDTDTSYLPYGPAYYTRSKRVATLPTLPDASYPAGTVVFNQDDLKYYITSDGNSWGLFPTNVAVYRYPNTQEAAPLWFHDHLLGGTRINATFAGLAGAYHLIDPGLTLPEGLLTVGLDTDGSGGTLPDAANEFLIPLVIQDRMFDTQGQLYFPNVGVNTEHPYWVPEFVGDTIVVNGKVWPYLDVDQQRYRFLLINGSNSRPYNMFLQDLTNKVKGPRMWVIATDGGYLDSPVLIDPNATGAQVKAGVQKSLMMMPGERYEIIIDFNDPVWKALLPKKAKFPLNLVLRNTAPTVDGNPKASTEGRIMQFRVSDTGPSDDSSYNPATSTDPLRSPIIRRLVDAGAGTPGPGVHPDLTRELTLNEVPGAGGPLEALVNNSKWSGLRPDDTPIPNSTFVYPNYLTELPVEGDTEVWEIVNMTADSHPIHLHGLQFQLMNRQPYDTKGYMAAYNGAFPGSATIIDPMTGEGYAAGVFIPGYGPPLAYAPGDAGYDATLQGGKYGGNPDVDNYLLGVAAPPLSYEAGWKDTVIMHPGEVSRIVVRIAPQDKAIGAGDLYWDYQPNALNGVYVWHCHITDHEDNEMMRPDMFMPNPLAVRTYIQGIDY